MIRSGGGADSTFDLYFVILTPKTVIEREKMANRTVKDAKSIKGTNPQYLVEKIIRTRIYDSKYWKEECFGLTCRSIRNCYSN